jgi:hypothetical protein
MKNLQYIKLFEAFDSNILTKTLGYIKDKSEKQNFLTTIKGICSQISYPLSQLNDDFFEYLSFKKALEKADMTGDEPCEATSKQEFPQYAVEGEKCTNGKIKRQWGARTREVACPVCGGSGVKPKKSEVKLLKFWFDKDGKSQGVTAVDGVIRPIGYVGSAKYSKKLSDYEIVKPLSHDELLELKTGSFIKAIIQGSEMVCYIFKEGSAIYAIQSLASGSTPGSGQWRSIDRYAWRMGRAEYRDAYLLKQIVKDKDKTEVNPYEWNVGLYPRRNYSGLQIDSHIDVKNQIKDAHFAIVLDFGKIKKLEYKTTGEIKDEREESKSGSKLDPEQSDDSIRRKNIERYISTLAKSLDISSDITNCDKLISRALGYKNALYMISSTNITSDISYVIEDYLRILKEDSDKSYYITRLTDRTNKLFKNGLKQSSEVSKSLKIIKDKLKSDTNLEQPAEKYIEFIDSIDDLSSTIYDKINETHIECIEDFEVVNQLINSIKNVLKSDRYPISRSLSYFVDNLIRYGSESTNRTYSYLVDDYYIKIDQSLESIVRVKKIIERM